MHILTPQPLMLGYNMLNSNQIRINNSSVTKYSFSQGFSLVELMIGLVIGLIATLVITNVLSTFEQKKRTTTGAADAQTNGSIALYSLMRDSQNAGFGLPVYASDQTPFNCPVTTTTNNAASGIGIFPVVIVNGNGANGSDTISIRYGDTMRGGGAVAILAGTSANNATVDNNIGCQTGDNVLIVNTGTSPSTYSCNMSTVTGISAAGVSPVTITISNGAGVGLIEGNFLSCLGSWNEFQYAVANNQLTRAGVPLMPDIVNLQAQYGISDIANSNQVTSWVDATGIWAYNFAAGTPSLSNRNRIKAIRVAIVARDGLLQTGNVTNACSSLTAAAPTGLCAWSGTDTINGVDIVNAAPSIDLTADANWQRYRYKVYETIIPIRNVIYSKDVL